MLIRFVFFLAWLCVTNALVVPGISHEKLAATVSPQPMKFDFRVRRAANDKDWENWKSCVSSEKRSVYQLPLENHNDISYLIDIYVGSDRQKASVVLDTGSGHVWVSRNKTSLGYYNPLSSKSSLSTGINYLSGYADGTRSTGLYYNDTIRLFRSDFPGSVALENFQFGVVHPTSTQLAGVLGLAGRGKEKTRALRNNNFVWGLKEAGYISKASFSLFLNTYDSEYGSVIFGGIDTSKYEAPLTSYPVNASVGGLAITLGSIIVDGTVFAEGNGYLLDLGTTLGFVSKNVMDHLDSLFNPTFVELGGIVYRQVSCNQPADKYFEFEFGSNSIRFSYDQAVSRQGATCYLGFTYHQNLRILGDIFLRQAYVYYNLSDKIIAIAQARYSGSSSVIIA